MKKQKISRARAALFLRNHWLMLLIAAQPLLDMLAFWTQKPDGGATVAGAIRLLRPCGVDVSSGIESGGGKDAEKMAAFVAAVRREYP